MGLGTPGPARHKGEARWGEADMIIQAIRSLVFYALFLGQTVILAILLGTYTLFHRGWSAMGLAIGQYWAASNMVFLRFVVGIRSKVTGGDNIPEGGCIIAAKHMSDWDIFAILPYTGRPAFIAKKELLDIPFFGWAAKALDTIPVDRSKKSDAVAPMLDAARAAIERKCRIVIYPEGTRKAPLADPDYRFGIAKLYAALNVPVVPVALDSGLYWSRNSLVLWPGTARARFLPAIKPGLTAEQFHAELERVIETATDDMIAEALDKGVARPLPAGFRARLEARRAARMA